MTSPVPAPAPLSRARSPSRSSALLPAPSSRNRVAHSGALALARSRRVLQVGPGQTYAKSSAAVLKSRSTAMPTKTCRRASCGDVTEPESAE